MAQNGARESARNRHLRPVRGLSLSGRLAVLFDQSFAASLPVVALPNRLFGAELVVVSGDEAYEGAQLLELDDVYWHRDGDGVEAPAAFLDIDQTPEALTLAYLELRDMDRSELGVRGFVVCRHRCIVADRAGFW